jgi:hypothetical protein
MFIELFLEEWKRKQGTQAEGAGRAQRVSSAEVLEGERASHSEAGEGAPQAQKWRQDRNPGRSI